MHVVVDVGDSNTKSYLRRIGGQRPPLAEILQLGVPEGGDVLQFDNAYASPIERPSPPSRAWPLALPVPTLASRGSRFLARLVDNLIPIAVFLFFAGSPTDLVAGGPSDLGGVPMGAMRQLGLMLLIIGGFTIFQWMLISVSGQSIGKKLLGIKILKEDGEEAGFTSGVLLREWVIAFLSAIPLVGGFIGLADALAIFGESQKCLHDMIAGTKVVSTESIRGRDFVAHCVGPQGQLATNFAPPFAAPAAPQDTLGRLRVSPVSPALLREVEQHLQELSRRGATRDVLEVYKASQQRSDVSLSDRSLLIVEQAAAEQGDAELAVAVVRALMAAHPRSGLIPRALWDTAQLQRRAGRTDLADLTFDALIERYPDDPFAREARARRA